MNFSDGRGLKCGAWLPNEGINAEDVNFLGESLYSNMLDMIVSIIKSHTNDVILNGMDLTWTSGMAASLSGGVAVGFSGKYYQNGLWGWVNSPGDTFLVNIPAAQALTFDAGHATYARYDNVEVRPLRQTYNQKNRQFKDPVTLQVTSASVNTRVEYTFEVQITKGTPAASPVAPAKSEGWIKVGEVYVPASATVLSQSSFRGVTGSYDSMANKLWTTGAGVTWRRPVVKGGGRTAVITDLTSTPNTINSNMEVILCNSAAAMTNNLPAATGSGQLFKFENRGTGIVTLDANSTETVNGKLLWVLLPGQSCEIIDAATGVWRVLCTYGDNFLPDLSVSPTILYSGSFTPPAGTTWVYFILVGGGGNGGDALANANSGGGGGGAGAVLEGWLPLLAFGGDYTIHYAPATGNAAEYTCFNAVPGIKAYTGIGGGLAETMAQGGHGGAAAASGSGSLGLFGSGTGAASGKGANTIYPGIGGSAGGAGRATDGNGTNGGYGAGGGGALVTGSTTRSGGLGGSGFVVLWFF